MESLRGVIRTQNTALYTKLLNSIDVRVINLIAELSGDTEFSLSDSKFEIVYLLVTAFGGGIWF